jgi:Family of unknown function (DUF5946)
MSPTRCEECGARYRDAADSCQGRFEQLLALDHSRQEPWGSRHGLAFAAFALQHPRPYSAATVASARELIQRVAGNGESLAQVVAEFRARRQETAAHVAPTSAPDFAVTIADLDTFAAATYPDDLLRWARAALGEPGGGAV